MTYVSVITLVAYALVLVLLAAVSVVDIRSRRVPNVLTAALAVLWVAWRLVLGFAGEYMGLGFRTELLSPAPNVIVPPGLEIGGISFASGILGSVILGGGLLVLTTIYEALRKKESFGGGDIKLMAVLGLFLGLERGIICLLAACVLSLVFALGRSLARRLAEASPSSQRRSRDAAASTRTADANISSGQRARSASEPVSEPFLSGAIREISAERDRDSLLAGTMPFAPFIALGTLVAFVA